MAGSIAELSKYRYERALEGMSSSPIYYSV